MGAQRIVFLNTTFINVHIIAGKDSCVDIRDKYKITKEFNINSNEINRKVGTVQGKYYDYEVHWYETDGNQYRLKMKNKPKERK